MFGDLLCRLAEGQYSLGRNCMRYYSPGNFRINIHPVVEDNPLVPASDVNIIRYSRADIRHGLRQQWITLITGANVDCVSLDLLRSFLERTAASDSIQAAAN